MAPKTKTKPAPKRKAKHPETLIGPHPFAPGDKVQIHEAEAVTVERQEHRRPIPKALETATVDKAGEIKVRLPVGSYVAAGQREKQMLSPHSEPFQEFDYVAFSVKEV